MSQFTAPKEPLDLLVVAAHPDDAEISVGGTIAKFLSEGYRVGVVDLTNGEPTPHGSLEVRAQETAKATKALGLTWRGNLGLSNRSLEPNLENRTKLAECFRLTRPQLIFSPFEDDIHPDHVAASQLVRDARFWSKLSKTNLAGERFWPPQLVSYWSIHLRLQEKPSFVVDVSEHMETKLAAARCYRSQLITGRPDEFPTIFDDIEGRGRYWGWSIGAAYGEPFNCKEQLAIRKASDVFSLSISPQK